MNSKRMMQQFVTNSAPSALTLPKSIARFFGISFGIGTQLLFLFTVIYLFAFLRFGSDFRYENWWLVDSALAIGFCLPHSILLAPPILKRLKAWVPSGLMGCIHCSVTCGSLLMMFHYWGGTDAALWRFTGWTEKLVIACFYGSWLMLFYSLYLTGMGYQTGLIQWWNWVAQTKPKPREFVTRGAFRFMRHPVYMSFLGLIWFTPTMTLDHAILTFFWTAYIFAGSYFKDRRLLKFIGQPYFEYGKKVTGLPLIGFGPLRRFK